MPSLGTNWNPSTFPIGPGTKHIKESHGGDTDLMKFYSTTNQTTYGRRFPADSWQPRTGRHTGTGYLSNFRPQVYYSSRLDEVDNPAMGHIVRDNYSSITQKSYRPYTDSKGLDPFPYATHQAPSGFVRDPALHAATQKMVNGVFIDRRIASAPVDVSPKYKPYLHKIQSKDPVELENKGYGPSYMKTESQQKFKGEQLDRSFPFDRANGPNEDTGFTHNKNDGPIDFHPDYAHKNDVPAWLTDRPTGTTQFMSDFRPARHPNGMEPFPKLSDRASRDTAFTSGMKPRPEYVAKDAYDHASDMPGQRLDRVKKQDPAEYMNLINPNNHSSVQANSYQGKPWGKDPTEYDLLNKTGVGTKEPTGHVENNDRFVQKYDNPARFITHYQTRFTDKNPHGLDRYGHVWGNTQTPKPDGFTRSTKVDSMGPDIDSNTMLRSMEPYQGRSIRARDSYFDNHANDHKSKSAKSVTFAV